MATEDAAGPTGDDRPELLIKLQERKVRHKQRHIVHRAAVVVAGVLIVCAGIVMSGPGVPGPGIVTIIIGLTFLVIPALAAALIAQLRSLWVTLVAGFVIGLVQSCLTAFSDLAEYRTMTPFVLAIVALLWFARQREPVRT